MMKHICHHAVGTKEYLISSFPEASLPPFAKASGGSPFAFIPVARLGGIRRRGIKTAIEKQDSYCAREIQEKLFSMLNAIEALEKLKSRKVLIKPNCTGAFAPEEARTTHPKVLEALIDILKELGSDIIIGESSSVGVDTKIAFEKTGILEVAKKSGVKLIDFKHSKYQKIVRQENLAIKEICLPEEVMESEIIVSLAKLKTNFVSVISCTMKNLKGLLEDWQKKEFHEKGLKEAIVDLYSAVSEKCLGIIDGIEGSEMYSPRHSGVLIAAPNLFTCDLISAKIMGIHPLSIGHILLAYAHGLGDIHIQDTEIFGKMFTLNPPFKNSPPELKDLEREFGVKIIDGNPCSSCIGSLYLSLKKTKTKKLELLHNIKIAIGDCKNSQEAKGAIRFGLCSYKNNDPLSVKGCSPRSDDFMKVLEEGQKNI